MVPGQDPPEHPELLLVEPELLLEDERAARDVAEQPGHRQPGHEHEADERAVAQQAAEYIVGPAGSLSGMGRTLRSR